MGLDLSHKVEQEDSWPHVAYHMAYHMAYSYRPTYTTDLKLYKYWHGLPNLGKPCSGHPKRPMSSPYRVTTFQSYKLTSIRFITFAPLCLQSLKGETNLHRFFSHLQTSEASEEEWDPKQLGMKAQRIVKYYGNSKMKIITNKLFSQMQASEASTEFHYFIL